MIHFPPTSLTLREEDLEYHLRRIYYYYNLEAELRQLHRDYDDNSYSDDPAFFDSYSLPSHSCSSEGESDSDSPLGFDSAVTEKATDVDYRKDDNTSSTCSSGSWNVPDVEGGRGEVLRSNNAGSTIDITSQPSCSPFADNIAQHQHSPNVIPQTSLLHPSLLPSLTPDCIPSKSVITAQRFPHPSSPELQSLETALRDLSLRVYDSASAQAKTVENQRTHCSQTTTNEWRFCRNMEDRTKTSPTNADANLREGSVPCSIHPQPTNTADKGPSTQAAPMAGPAPKIDMPSSPSAQSDSNTDGSKTPRPSQHQTRPPQSVSVNDDTSSLSPALSTSAIWTSSENSPVRHAHSQKRPSPKGFKLSPTPPGAANENQDPSLDEMLVEAKRLQNFFAAMVADLDLDVGPDDFGLNELRHDRFGNGTVYRPDTGL